MHRKRIVLTGLLLLSTALPVLGGAPREYRRKLVDQWSRCIRTTEDMLALQTAIEAYGVDHPTFPMAKTMGELRDLVEPTYIARTPLADAWGTPFRYLVSADGKSYRLVSAGSDRAFQDTLWGSAAFLSDSEADAVLTSEGWATYREWVIQE